jgi:outer membrane receptor protein involved in Fe transport
MEDTVHAPPNAMRAPVRMRLVRITAPFAVALFLAAPQLVAPRLLNAASGLHSPQVVPQEAPDSTRADTLKLKPVILDPINVTATREEKGVFETAAPVSVVDTVAIREQKPKNASELIRDLPGIDINGVGANQERPTIRGQRGQRILLLEDGLRLNNARRQADFGELPAIVDITGVQRVEVVRGPASVLYGSDAIGGVVNMLQNEAPSYGQGDRYRGNLSFSWRDQGDQLWPSGEVYGRAGHIGYGASASYRNTTDYLAPGGSFGDVSFDNDVNVNDSGVRDENYGVYLDYAFDENQKIAFKGDFYRAEDAGFGYVSNADLGQPDDAQIELSYPDQSVDRFTLGYQGIQLDLPIADRIQVSGSYMDNERTFAQNIGIFDPFGPGTAIRIQNSNYTDLEGFGVRGEASKLLFGKHLLTYGGDYYHDDSFNRDFSRTQLEFGPPEFVPPQVSEDSTPNVPNATYERGGVFAQVDLQLGQRAALIVGGRYQSDKATPKPTDGFGALPESSKNDQFVGAANLLVEALPSLHLVGNVGTGFRSPNLIELFFDGATPEGGGYQVSNPNLDPETSLNFDLGIKYRRANVAFEGFYFQNEIEDGIRIAQIPDSVVGPFPAFQNVNVEKIRVKGVELLAEWQPVLGFTIGATYTWIDGDDLTPTSEDGVELDQNNPVGDSYSNRITGELAYRAPNGRFWAAYQIRHNGEQQNSGSLIGTDIDADCGVSESGEFRQCTIPSFTVMHLRGGVRLFDYGQTTSSLMIGVENLTNELYAEFSNASFFRPNPKRTFVVSWVTSF